MMAESNYRHYPGKTRQDKVRNASETFARNYEGMKTAYETYKRADEPSSSQTQRDIRQGSERAIARVQRTGRESDAEERRESRRGRR